MVKSLPILFIAIILVLASFIYAIQQNTVDHELTNIQTDLAALYPPEHANALAMFRDINLCVPDSWTLSIDTPTSIYQVKLPENFISSENTLVFYQRAAINNQFAVMFAQPDGCFNFLSSGRSLPFKQRFISSIYPNVSLENVSHTTEIYIFLQDAKSRNLWLGITGPNEFQETSASLWLYSGLYIGALFVFTIVGAAIAYWQKSKLALAYSVHVGIILLWFIQNFGIGSAFFSFWPSEQYFSLLQGASTGLIVLAMTVVSIMFLRPGKSLTLFFCSGSALTVLLFVISPYFHKGYEYGAFGLSILAVIIVIYIFSSIGRRTTSEKLFAVGLVSSIIIGSAQAISVFTGDNFLGLAIFSFSIGKLIESTFLLVAIIEQLLFEFKKIQDKLVHEVSHDSLTGLPNRYFLEKELRQLFNEKPNPEYCLFFIDLDRFKEINESMGHEVGDSILLVITSRLQQSFSDPKLLARFGGDEFCLILENVENEAQASTIGEEILSIVEKPILLVGRELKLSACIGVCFNMLQHGSAESVLRNADVSVYAAKEDTRTNVVIFNEKMYLSALEKFQIEQDILPGLRNNEFLVYFQPIVELPGSHLKGFEALARWNHSSKGWLPPQRFIEIAEQTGLIRIISEHVIKQVIDTISLWKAEHRWPDNAYCSINISSRQLLDDSLLSLLKLYVSSGKIKAQDIRLEITESSLVSDVKQVTDMLLALRECGFKILIDDFGTGYSSLRYLHSLPIDVLKIDRSFVLDVENNEHKQSLIKTIIAMAEALGLETVAEGIEDQTHHDILTRYGCTKAQGYYYDKPRSAEEIQQDWLMTN